jgi:hypothetical protein
VGPSRLGTAPTAPRRRRCALTSCAYGLPRWLTCCCAHCAASPSSTPNSPERSAARSASSSSRSALGTRLSAGGRWIRTIGTPQRNNYSRPPPFNPPQFALRKRNRLLRTRNRWFESTSLQQTVCLSPAVVFEGREPGFPRGSGLLAWQSGRQRR